MMQHQESWGRCRHGLTVWKLAFAASVCLIGSALGAEKAAPSKADEHTVALLHFDEMKGTTARDASGHGYHATFEKKYRDPEWYKHGRFRGCVLLDGISGVGHGRPEGAADGLVWPKGGTPDPKWAGFTAELWVRHAHLEGWQFYMVNRGAYNFVAKGNKVFLALNPQGHKWIQVWSDPCLKPDLWHHVAFTYDGKTARVFCDGVERGRTAAKGRPPKGNHHTFIGHDSDLRPSQIRGVCGLMDELRTSNIARTRFPKGPHKPKFPIPGVNQRTPTVKEFTEPEPEVRDVRVNGVVFADANGNGKRDPGERGIRDVWVTDGEQIKLSRMTGAYELRFKAEEYRIVYITQPKGYRTTSPWYRLIKQDDKETDYTFDFALQRDPASLDRDFAFLVTADSQFTTADEGRLLKAEMAQITRTTGTPRFHFICGDLTMTGWLQEWRYYADALSALKIPNYNVFGGHGGNYLARTKFKRGSVHHYNLFCGPTYYMWNYGGYHFVVYNSVGYLTKAGRQRQETWMKAALGRLKPGAPVILIAHTPITADRWRKGLKQVACFYGHWHENYVCQYAGVPYLCTNPIRGRDWGSYTRVVRFCRFRNGTLYTEIRPTGQYKRVQFIQPHEGQKVPRGRLPLRMAALDSASPVEEVAAEIVRDGKVVAKPTLTRLGQFTWGTDWDTTGLSAGTYRFRVTVRDDRPEKWPARSCGFTVGGRAIARARPGKDWPGLFRSLEDLRSIPEEVAAPMDLVWSVPTGGRNQWATSPIVYRGKVYLGPENMNVGGVTHTVQCYHAATGRRVWKAEVDSPVRFGLVAAEGRVFTQTHEGMAWCFDAETGRVVWRTRAYPHKVHYRPDDTKCAPLLRDGKLITYCERGPLTVLDASTGKKLAQWPRPGRQSRDYFGGPFPGKDRVWLTTLWGAYACDLMTGKPLWQTELRKFTRRGVAMPVVQGNRLYVRGYTATMALDAGDGTLLWRSGRDHVYGIKPVPTVAGGVVYSGGRTVSALDAKTGRALWRYSALRQPDRTMQRQVFAGGSSPLVSGGLLYVGRDDGDIVALNRRSGKCVWRHPVCMAVKSSPVVSGNMLFVYDFDGNLNAFASAE